VREVEHQVLGVISVILVWDGVPQLEGTGTVVHPFVESFGEYDTLRAFEVVAALLSLFRPKEVIVVVIVRIGLAVLV
jgi:hypothetical protein